MQTEATKPFKHPGMSKLGTLPLCAWPRKERSAKHFPRYPEQGASKGGKPRAR